MSILAFCANWPSFVYKMLLDRLLGCILRLMKSHQGLSGLNRCFDMGKSTFGGVLAFFQALEFAVIEYSRFYDKTQSQGNF